MPPQISTIMNDVSSHIVSLNLPISLANALNLTFNAKKSRIILFPANLVTWEKKMEMPKT